jgi:hypothetical protein
MPANHATNPAKNLVDKGKFDSVLRRLINSPPTSMAEAKATPKLRKDGQLKRKKAVRTS